MSLINDALKRASQTIKNQEGPRPSAGPVLEPVVQKSPGRSSILILLALGILIGLGGIFLLSILQKPGPTPTVADTTKAPASEKAATAQAMSSKASTNTLQVPSPAPAAAQKATPVAATTASSPPAQAAAVAKAPAVTPAVALAEASVASRASTQPPAASQPASPPTLRLQAIFFRLKNPSVMINSKTLAVGDQIEGARLISIERSQVSLDFNGTLMVLRLPN